MSAASLLWRLWHAMAIDLSGAAAGSWPVLSKGTPKISWKGSVSRLCLLLPYGVFMCFPCLLPSKTSRSDQDGKLFPSSLHSACTCSQHLGIQWEAPTQGKKAKNSWLFQVFKTKKKTKIEKMSSKIWCFFEVLLSSLSKESKAPCQLLASEGARRRPWMISAHWPAENDTNYRHLVCSPMEGCILFMLFHRLANAVIPCNTM